MSSRSLFLAILLAACSTWASAASTISQLTIKPQMSSTIVDRGRYMTPMGVGVTFFAHAPFAGGLSLPVSQSEVVWSLEPGSTGAVDAQGRYLSNQFGIATLRVRLASNPSVTATAWVGAYNQIFTSFKLYASLQGGVPYSIPASSSVRISTTAPADQYGTPIPLPLPPIAWSVSAPGLASIRSDGLLTTTAATGPFTVTANAGGVVVAHLACASYTSTLTSIAIGALGPTYLLPGGTVNFYAVGTDQRGNVLPIPSPLWTLAPGSIGTVFPTSYQGGTYRAPQLDGVADVILRSGGLASAPVRLVVTVPAAFPLGNDTTTQGDWCVPVPSPLIARYGRERHVIPHGSGSFGSQTYPDARSASVNSIAYATHTVYRGSVRNERRGLLWNQAGRTNFGLDRWLSYYQSTVPITFGIAQSDTAWHVMSFYLVDWDRLGARHRIELIHPVTRAVLAETTVANFGEGVYVRFAVKGDVHVRMTPLTLAPLQVHGVFIDPFGGPG